MNTSTLLAQIGRAAADRETSADAMRWTPVPGGPSADAEGAGVRPAITPALQQIRDAYQQVRGAYLEAARHLAAAHDRRRAELVLVPPRPPRQEPDPKAWRAFVPRPERTPRARHRPGPHPRRLSVARAPKRCGRRP
ncbi:hypothetical protein J0910_00445 [Nocardiopsis sp. CNT-189]|uniref:hypothetical protein n=1 Tax=Nocardiopsis oceanisediminis TaxID=2816862 RepID=UPI003B2B900A